MKTVVVLDKKALSEFQELYKEVYGVELSPEKASSIADNLLSFMKFLYSKPIRNEDLNKYLYGKKVQTKTFKSS